MLNYSIEMPHGGLKFICKVYIYDLVPTQLSESFFFFNVGYEIIMWSVTF